MRARPRAGDGDTLHADPVAVLALEVDLLLRHTRMGSDLREKYKRIVRHIYIYIYIERERGRESVCVCDRGTEKTQTNRQIDR